MDNCKKIGPNGMVVNFANGDTILVSYTTIVGASIAGEFYVTEKRHSDTTQRHITKWLGGARFHLQPQAWFSQLRLLEPAIADDGDLRLFGRP